MAWSSGPNCTTAASTKCKPEGTGRLGRSWPLSQKADRQAFNQMNQPTSGELGNDRPNMEGGGGGLAQGLGI